MPREALPTCHAAAAQEGQRRLPADGGAVELRDTFGRAHHSLRISVTDRCNIRCFYCMPDEGVSFLPRQQLLTFEEITRVVTILTTVGVTRLRLTGGEPLLRRDLDSLVGQLSGIAGVTDLALTTNGILLANQAKRLQRAGLRRINISLDTLNETTFRKISRRQGLDRVLQGIDAVLDSGFSEVRLNALAIKGIVEAEAVALVRFASARGLTMRFIEYMPLDAERRWNRQHVFSGDELLALLACHFGPPRSLGRDDPAQPATDYQFAGGARIGLIRPVTAPFCGACDRLRLSAEGGLRNCLFSHREWSLRDAIRADADDAELLQIVRASVSAKAAGHLISQPGFQPIPKAMYQIGG